jgi:hypothetical protein
MAASSGDFGAKYVDTNLSHNAAVYDEQLFEKFLGQLANSDKGQLRESAPAILVSHRWYLEWRRV